MPLTIPDDVLRETGLSERDLLVGLACYLFDSDLLDHHAASRLAGMNRGEFERELLARHIPIHRPTKQELLEDIRALREAGI